MQIPGSPSATATRCPKHVTRLQLIRIGEIIFAEGTPTCGLFFHHHPNIEPRPVLPGSLVNANSPSSSPNLSVVSCTLDPAAWLLWSGRESYIPSEKRPSSRLLHLLLNPPAPEPLLRMSMSQHVQLSGPGYRDFP